MRSFQNLLLLKNLYRLKALEFKYIDPFSINHRNTHEKVNTIEQLNTNISTCHLCDLSKSRTQSMSGVGNPNADVLIVDYSVSQTQDSENKYYGGHSGEILQNMIENVLRLKIEEVYLTHLIKCKPLLSNTPSHSEWDSCKSYFYSQLTLIKPKIVITLGKEAYEKVTSEDNDFNSVRGNIIDFKDYKLIPIYHPNHLLRNPDDKKITLIDLKNIKSIL